MGTFEVPDAVILQDTQGEILGNVLLIENNGLGKTVITVDLFVKPDQPEELFHDENTMPKVILALYDQGLSFADAGKVVDAILDKGVVFREIVRPE